VVTEKSAFDISPREEIKVDEQVPISPRLLLHLKEIEQEMEI
jgi:hypothetical protein